MKIWNLTLAGLGAFAFGLAARAQVAPDPTQMPPEGAVRIQLGGPGISGPIIIQGGGVIIFNPQVDFVSPQTTSPGSVNLPIVNEGFTNDADVNGSLKPLVDRLKSADYGER